MNELSLHIERVLLTHDCVVVPHFGGFVAMSSPAVREDTEQLFFPPLRLVRFNPDLTEDDGLLVNDVRRLHGGSETEAKRYIQRLVLELRQQLLADGQVDFGCIGVFTQDDDGRVSFSPCQAGVVTPYLFGLDAFAMPKLTTAQRQGNASSSLHHRQTDGTDNHTITIHISRRSLRNVVAAAAITLLCVLFSSPFDKESSSSQASMLPTEPVEQTTGPIAKERVSPSAASQTATANHSEVAVSSNSLETPDSTALTETPELAEATEVTETPELTTETSNYCIVLACNISMKRAQDYVEVLRERGYERARVFDNGRMIRVIIDGFETEAEAMEENNILHHLSKEYASTWVMEL